MSKKIPVYAWYFPNWHPGDPLNERWHGKGWSEWESVKHAAQRFEGHTIYHPLWGYEDESDPAVMGKKIDTALEYGVDGFLWDYYWSEGVGPYRLKALEGFFKAMETRKNFKIALMWCNHDSIYVHPASYFSTQIGRRLADGHLSPQGFIDGSQYMIEQCFNRDCYMTIRHEGQDKLYFIIWHPGNLIDGLGGVQGARTVLDNFRERVRKALGKELYIATYFINLPGWNNGDYAGANRVFHGLVLDGCVSYGTPGDRPADAVWPRYPYSYFVDVAIRSYEENAKRLDAPLNITVSQGWDSSPRTVPNDMYDNIGYPFCWITDKKNPEDFKRCLKGARAFYESGRYTGDFITLTTWNEWSEGNFMEPSVEQGYACLEAVRDVFGTQENPK